MNLAMKSLLLTALAGLTLVGCNQGGGETATGEATVPTAGANTVTTGAGTPAGEGTDATPVATGKPKGSVKVGDQALCAVCAVKEGQREAEPVQATLDYKGKTYAFCNADEKAEFISSPSKYAGPTE